MTLSTNGASGATSSPQFPVLQGEAPNPKRKMLETLKKRIDTLMTEGSLELYKPEGLNLQIKCYELELELTKSDYAQLQSATTSPNVEFQQKFAAEQEKSAKLKAELEETQNKLSAVASEKTELQSAKRKLESDVSKLASSVKTQKEEWLKQEDALRKRVAILTQSSLRPVASSTEAARSSDSEKSEQAAKKYKKEIEDRNQFIAVQKNTIEGLEQEKAASEAQILSFNETLEQLQTLILQNETKIQELAKLNTNYKKSWDLTLEALDGLKCRFGKEVQARSTIENNAEDLRKQVQALGAKITGTVEASEKLVAENTALNLKLEEVQALLKQREAKLAAFDDLSRKFGTLIAEPKK